MTIQRTKKILLALALCLPAAPARAGELLHCSTALDSFATATRGLAARVRQLDDAQESVDGCRRSATAGDACAYRENLLVGERDGFRAAAVAFDEARASMERACPLLYASPKPANPVKP